MFPKHRVCYILPILLLFGTFCYVLPSNKSTQNKTFFCISRG
uniref:Uncharacterized protein n=1 Tax=Arundo donax TaxID=35708 RepID=A0A0A8ZJ92_ARUDO